MKKTLLQLIAEHLFGYKYYANIVNVKGTAFSEICSYIFETKEEAGACGLTADVWLLLSCK